VASMGAGVERPKAAPGRTPAWRPELQTRPRPFDGLRASRFGAKLRYDSDIPWPTAMLNAAWGCAFSATREVRLRAAVKARDIQRPSKNDGLVGRPSQNEGLVGRPSRNDGLVGRPSRNEGLVGRPSRNEGLVGRPSRNGRSPSLTITVPISPQSSCRPIVLSSCLPAGLAY